jgi:E3 ubiquitin-protein ligase CCNP1IP1
MQVDQDTLRRKNDELVQAFREKSRKHLQTQELYDKLKRRAMLGQVQNAALDAVDHTIQASITANRYVDRLDEQNQRPQAPLFTNQQSNSLQHPTNTDVGGNMGPPNFRGGNNESGWAGFSCQESVQRTFVRLDEILAKANFL